MRWPEPCPKPRELAAVVLKPAEICRNLSFGEALAPKIVPDRADSQAHVDEALDAKDIIGRPAPDSATARCVQREANARVLGRHVVTRTGIFTMRGIDERPGLRE